jgi:hypothetical protein
MDALQRNAGGRGCRRFSHALAALALAWSGGAVLAQEVVAVPAAHLSHAEGTVAYAPQGEKEWQDVQPRRVLKRGDRLWTDRGSRAEVQAGGHALRIDGQTQLILENVGDASTQLSLTQGSVVATVTGLNPGDSFEIGTPNLAFRARQAGDYRIDVDRRKGLTRIVVLSGAGVVFGEKGEALEVRNGQRVTFRERDLTRVQQPAFAATDDFDRWASARRRGEPTVSMPVLARSQVAPPPHTERVSSGPDIIISGPASALPGAKPAAAAPAPAAAKAQSIPNVVLTPAGRAAAPLRVAAPGAPALPQAAQAQARDESRAAAQAEAEARGKAQAQARAKAQEEAQAKAEAAARAKAQDEARAKAQARAREQQEQKRVAQKHAEERRRALAAKREEQRREAQAKREQEQKRVAAARRAEEERRQQAQARRAAEEKRLAAARKAEAQRIAEARKQQLARLQEQARREEQAAQARREQQARRADEERREAQARREELARREEQVRREEQARREDDYRRRMLAEQARREQERREQEVWLRQQQPPQPARPTPMGVPFRRVS